MQKRDYRPNPHVMLDSETLGVSKDAVVCSIGAVIFAPNTTKISGEFHQHIDWQSAIDDGRVVDASTVQWWMAQSDAARKALLDGNKTNAVTWKAALQKFAEFFPKYGYVWGNGATFDVTLLETAYKKHGYNGRPPWNFGNVRDVRTIAHLAYPYYPESIVMDGVAHDALADAIHQANVVSAMWQHLKSQGG